MNRDRASEPEERRLTKECRSFLRLGSDDREALDPTLREHVDACAFCCARRNARRRLTAALSIPPTPPPQLHAAAFVDELRAKIVEASEASPLGRILGSGMPVVAPDGAWPSDLLETELGRRTMAVPDQVTGPTWARVRASVLQDVASYRSQRRQEPMLRNRTWALASVAVAAIICTWLVSDGTQTAPEIVITDVVSMPNIDLSPMTVLRHGEQR